MHSFISLLSASLRGEPNLEWQLTGATLTLVQSSSILFAFRYRYQRGIPKVYIARYPRTSHHAVLITF